MAVHVLEDDPGVSDALALLLDHLGFEVVCHADAEGLFRSEPPTGRDIVFVDLMLPGMKGQTLLKQLRSKNNDVPVLIISAQDKLQDIIEHLNLGADDYLAKPFDIKELEARLRSLLRRGDLV